MKLIYCILFIVIVVLLMAFVRVIDQAFTKVEQGLNQATVVMGQ